MKKFTFIIWGFIGIISCSISKNEIQTIKFDKIEKFENKNLLIKANEFEGVIFSKYCNYGPYIDSVYKFTPSLDEIELVENLIKSKIKKINKHKINQFDGCPIIDKNLDKYKRQYVGYFDNKGDKIIFINFLWHTFDSRMWLEDQVSINDGCSYYWSIQVNLLTKELFDFRVNGLG